MLSDTVGFIRDLPHRLIASFKATLEEARQADLLIHVADVSNPAAAEQISAVFDVLHELDIDEKAALLVLNKVDCVDDPVALEAIRNRYPNAVPISAATGAGLPELAAAVSKALSSDFLELDVQLPISDGRNLAYLAKYGEILRRTFTEEHVLVHCRLARMHLAPLLDNRAVEVIERQGAPHAPTTAMETSDAIEDVA